MKIVQVAESLSFGDAVSNDVVEVDKLLKKMGVCGGIFVVNAKNIDKRYLHKIAEPIESIPHMDEDDILILQHAIANSFCSQISKIKCKKVLIYHNITPPHFFEDFDEGLRGATQKGLEQLKAMNREFDCCIAISEFNKQDLLRAGYRCPIYVCPVLIPFEDYETTKPSNKITEKYSDDGTNILFVGRLSPNKKQEDVIRTFAIYKKYYDPKARLFLVGSDSMEKYGYALRKYVEMLGVEDVFITGSVPFDEIIAYYTIADVFVCMSEHEGLCVPLIEAMFFDVPIVAYKSCAIPYTLGNSGILLEKKDFVLAAGWINRVVTEKELRESILEKQKKQLQCFKGEKVSAVMENLLSNLMVQPNKKKCMSVNPPVFKKGDHRNSFLLVLPIKASDWEVAQNNIPFIQKNLNPREIVVISSKELENVLPKDVAFVDEDSLLPGLSLEEVRKQICAAKGDGKTAGWYLQQFLKLGFSKVCPDSYYLVWDADTIPTNEIQFFDGESGLPYLNLKREYIESYFKTAKALLNIDKQRPESFITEHMIFDTEICKKMLQEIEENTHLKGNYFWEKIISASSKQADWKQVFSEYETFGTYVMAKYPDRYKLRRLKTLRAGREYLGDNPSEEMLNWAGNVFDTVSFEHWSAPIFRSVSLCRNAKVRECHSLADIIRYVDIDVELQALYGNAEAKELCERLSLKHEFDWFFGNVTTYEDVTKL